MCGNPCRCTLLVLLSVAFLTLSGCRKDSSQDTQNKAQVILDKALDAWARGEAPSKYASGQPIQLVDPDWTAGYRLLSFLTAETTQAEGKAAAAVRCRVALSLKDPIGQKIDKEVFYSVKLGDPVVISREAK